MFVPSRTESEILLALYRYSLLTIDQLTALLHLERKTLYQAFHNLKEKGWVEPLPLGFIKRHVKGWILTKNGLEVAFGLTKEYRSRPMRQPPSLGGQAGHLYGSNQFFVHLIKESLTRPRGEGLIEWIGMRDAGNRYAVTDQKGKKTTPVRPDGIGTYRFSDHSETTFHVEYDTGSEHLWVIHNKLWQYADVLKQFWSDITLANVLFITREHPRSLRVLELWRDMNEEVFRRQPVPAVWTATEQSLLKQGSFEPVWMGIGGQGSFEDFPRLEGRTDDGMIPHGKQTRENPFSNRTTRKNGP